MGTCQGLPGACRMWRKHARCIRMCPNGPTGSREGGANTPTLQNSSQGRARAAEAITLPAVCCEH
eukprot:7862546-Alexandrium_andersonii.AAC.1